MRRFAVSIAWREGIDPPKGYTKSVAVCRAFLELHAPERTTGSAERNGAAGPGHRLRPRSRMPRRSRGSGTSPFPTRPWPARPRCPNGSMRTSRRSPRRAARHRRTSRATISTGDFAEALAALLGPDAGEPGAIQVLIERWRHHYNTIRPHSSLGYRPPAPEAILPNVERPTYAVDGLRLAHQLNPRQTLT